MATVRNPGVQAGGDPQELPRFRDGLSVQLRCLEALMVRDMMMRYGRGNLGFLWVLIEPMLLCVGVMIMWSLLKGGKEHGVDLIVLVVTGYMPLTLWRHVTNSSVMSIRRGAGLLYHRQISAIDTQIARIGLEFAGATAAFIVIIATMWTVGLIEPIQDFLMVVVGWMMMAAMAGSSSIIICGLTEYSEVWERFIQPYQYLMLPISGTFFMVDWLPAYAQEIIWFNPLVHCYEAVRAGFFGSRAVTHFDPWYTLAWSLGLMVVGLWLLDKARSRVHLG